MWYGTRNFDFNAKSKMTYKEFEHIYFHIYFGINETDNNKLWFIHNPEDKIQRNFVKKCKDMSPQEFDKIWLPFCEKQKVIRERRLKKFKNYKPSDFADMPMEQKIQYIDAIANTNKSKEELGEYLSVTYKNLMACLFSIQPSKQLLLEEQRDLNHFMNVLIGSSLDKAIKEVDKRTLKQRKQDLQDFTHLFCKTYKISEPELRFEEKEMIGQFHATGTIYNDGRFEVKGIIDINEQLLQDSTDDKWKVFGILFHELMHARQFRWEFSLDEKHSPFTKICKFTNDFTHYKAFNWEIYRLQPKEGHAYYMQWKFNEQCNERIFKGNAKQNVLDAPSARTLWYDYQSR